MANHQKAVEIIETRLSTSDRDVEVYTYATLLSMHLIILGMGVHWDSMLRGHKHFTWSRILLPPYHIIISICLFSYMFSHSLHQGSYLLCRKSISTATIIGYAGQPIFGIDQTQKCMWGKYKTIAQELIDVATKYKTYSNSIFNTCFSLTNLQRLVWRERNLSRPI